MGFLGYLAVLGCTIRHYLNTGEMNDGYTFKNYVNCCFP